MYLSTRYLLTHWTQLDRVLCSSVNCYVQLGILYYTQELIIQIRFFPHEKIQDVFNRHVFHQVVQKFAMFGMEKSMYKAGDRGQFSDAILKPLTSQ